jgi:hypothetical protein
MEIRLVATIFTREGEKECKTRDTYTLQVVRGDPNLVRVPVATQPFRATLNQSTTSCATSNQPRVLSPSAHLTVQCVQIAEKNAAVCRDNIFRGMRCTKIASRHEHDRDHDNRSCACGKAGSPVIPPNAGVVHTDTTSSS